MVEVLPIKSLSDEDSPIFGSLNVTLGKLSRAGLPVAKGIVVTAPNLKLKTILEHYDFGDREVFNQSLNLFKKEIGSLPIPESLVKDAGKHKLFFVSGQILKGVKELWLCLLNIWLEEIKQRLWKDGFTYGIAEGLEPQVVIFPEKIDAFGEAFFDPLSEDVVIEIKKGDVAPVNLKKLDELVKAVNQKLLIPHKYEWVIDHQLKIAKVILYTPPYMSSYSMPGMGIGYKGIRMSTTNTGSSIELRSRIVNTATKVFVYLSGQNDSQREVDGGYFLSEKVINLDDLAESYENLLLSLVNSVNILPDKPILLKLPDIPESNGGIRGAIRLLHQPNLFEILAKAVIFLRHKRAIDSFHLVIPYVRTTQEFLQIKRELAVRKISRKNSLQFWMEIAVPENILNLEDYLSIGLDGVALNLDELAAHLNGFDSMQEEVIFYKNEVKSLLKFLTEPVKILHKSKVPVIATGLVSINSEVLEFLVEKGVSGLVVEGYEAESIRNLLYRTEKRVILKRA